MWRGKREVGGCDYWPTAGSVAVRGGARHRAGHAVAAVRAAAGPMSAPGHEDPSDGQPANGWELQAINSSGGTRNRPPARLDRAGGDG
jgi:hypothetical protein